MIGGYPEQWISNYVIFCTLAASCGALLYWYLNNRFRTNISAPYEHYLPSHWSVELENKIEEITAVTEVGYLVRVAITGAPGSGKTDLATDYAHKHAGNASIVWRFVADTPENLWCDYWQLADALKIQDREKSSGEDDQGWHERICRQVNQYLSAYPGWILIFDNVKDLSHVNKFLPTTGNQKGTILFTTRDANLLPPKNSISISTGLNPTEATQLLYKITGLQPDGGAFALAKSLDYLPLYLLIAATIIRNTKEMDPRTAGSYALYNAHLQKLSIADAESEHEPHARQLDYTKTQHAVMRDAIKQLNIVNPEAAKLLMFCSYLAPTGISRELLESYIRAQNAELSDNAVRSKCTRLLFDIQRSSLLQYASGQAIYSIHRITQQISRQSYEITEDDATKILNAVVLDLPTLDEINSDFESSIATQTWKTVMPHMLVLSKHADLLKLSSMEPVATLFYNLGKLFNMMGNYSESITSLRQALHITEQCHGKESWHAVVVLNSLARTYLNSGGFAFAESVIKDAFNIGIKYHDENSVEISEILNNRGWLYLNTGKFDDAIIELEKVLSIRRQQHGNDNYTVAETLTDLGWAYTDSGQSDKAKVALEQALKIREKHYGKEHVEVAKVLNNLGWAYVTLGEYDKAAQAIKRALPIFKRRYGADHYEVAAAEDSLGIAYIKLAKYSEARDVLEHALPIIEKHFVDAEHWQLAYPLKHLGIAYGALGNLQEAKLLLERALIIVVKHRGADHVELLEILLPLLEIYESLRDMQKKNEVLFHISKIESNDTK